MRITITDAAHQAIQSQANAPLREPGSHRPDGSWSIELSPLVFLKIKAIMQPGEDWSSSIIRICAASYGLAVALRDHNHMPKDAHVIRVNDNPTEFRFIGRDESVNLTEGSKKFVIMSTKELERLFGHSITLDAEGKPENLSTKDCEVLGATMGLRQAIVDNPNLDAGAKARILTRLQEGLSHGDTVEELVGEMIESDKRQQTLEAKLIGLSPKERRMALKQMRRDLHKRRLESARSFRALDDEKHWLNKVRAGLEEMEDWSRQPLILQKPPATMFHQMRQAVIDGESLIIAALRDGAPAAADYEETWKDAAVFVVEHDWAAAFSTGQDYEGGEFKLPDDVCAFEFRISGRHIIAVTFEMDGRLYLQPIPLTKNGWLIPGSVYYFQDGQWEIERGSSLKDANEVMDELIDLLGRQVKAIAIALDAEVATSEVIRAPHKLNHARERRGKLPVSSYHVVSLARRSRAPRLEHDQAEPGTYTKKRLHFRRGHWRHFADHKTWIKWMLVGDPDLGFIEKHYKL